MSKSWKNPRNRYTQAHPNNDITMTSSVQCLAMVRHYSQQTWANCGDLEGKVTSFPTSRITWSDIHPQLLDHEGCLQHVERKGRICSADGMMIVARCFGLELTHISTNPPIWNQFKGTIDDYTEERKRGHKPVAVLNKTISFSFQSTLFFGLLPSSFNWAKVKKN